MQWECSWCYWEQVADAIDEVRARTTPMPMPDGMPAPRQRGLSATHATPDEAAGWQASWEQPSTLVPGLSWHRRLTSGDMRDPGPVCPYDTVARIIREARRRLVGFPGERDYDPWDAALPEVDEHGYVRYARVDVLDQEVVDGVRVIREARLTDVVIGGRPGVTLRPHRPYRRLR